MQASSTTRRKSAFVPWLASLVIGATAHAGWLIHDLREDLHEPRAVQLTIEAPEPGSRAVASVAKPARARSLRVAARHSPASARGRTLPPVCRHVSLVSPAPAHELEADPEPTLDWTAWIERTDRYSYTIDRDVLERVALAEDRQLAGLGVASRAIGLAEPVELRNIRAGTPLFLLGLRTGDRLVALSTHTGAALDRVELAIERRGRAIDLVYRLI